MWKEGADRGRGAGEEGARESARAVHEEPFLRHCQAAKGGEGCIFIHTQHGYLLPCTISAKTYIQICARTNIHARANTIKHNHTHKLTHKETRTRKHNNTHKHTITHKHIHTHSHACAHTHTRRHTNTHTLVYTHKKDVFSANHDKAGHLHLRFSLVCDY